MPNKISEATVTKQVKTYLEKIPGSKFVKRHGSGFGKQGEPDITGSFHGRHTEIELKRPGEEPTDLQYQRLIEWARSGAIAFWADNVQTVKDTLGGYTVKAYANVEYVIITRTQMEEQLNKLVQARSAQQGRKRPKKTLDKAA